MPTGQPTNAPTRITIPGLVELDWPGNGTYYNSNSTYWCHRNNHFHNSPNSWQQIFGGLELSITTDFLKSAKIWMLNWDAETDQLSMLPSDHKNVNYAAQHFIINNVTDTGVLTLEMAHQDNLSQGQRSALGEWYWSEVGQNFTWLPSTLWTSILRMPVYKFHPLPTSSNRCEDHLLEGKKFAIQLTDRRDRISRVYYHTMRIRTAGIILTDDVSVKTTNELHGEMLMQPDTSVLSNLNEFYTV